MISIFISHHPSDARTAADLQRQISVALQPREVVFWERKNIPPEEFRARAAAFLEKAQLFVAVLSMNYEDTPDVRWECAQAIETQRSRPGLQILSVLARATAFPAPLLPYPTALPPSETIENQAISRDHQLLRCAEAAKAVLAAAPSTNDIPLGDIALPLAIQDLRERLLAQTDRINHAPLLALLKRLIKDVAAKRVVLDAEEDFKQLREQTRLSQISVAALDEKSKPIEQNLRYLIGDLREEHLVAHWRDLFIRDYFRFSEGSREESTVPPFFVPVDEVQIPETLNLPVGPREQESLEQIGLLSFEQKNDFRRSLLLAKDAMAVKNYAQAFAHCDHVRTKIDPQSAQLYEYLLITFVQKEGAQRIMQDAVNGNDRLLQHVLLFASRLRDYQNGGKCPSSTTQHNLAIASEAISDAALRMYHALPNDPLLHTGKHAESVPDNRRALRVILGNTLKVCRLVHPSEELLEAAVIECCGGGKCHWMRRVDVVDGRFQFTPDGHFDLLGEINELLDMLQGMESDDPNKIVKGQDLLREDLYFSLLAKRQTLANQVAEDAKRRRPFTDVRASLIRFTQACLLGAEMFGDRAEGEKEESFLRLALEYLLPGLVVAPDAVAALPVRWFSLDARGEVVADPECADYQFDVLGIVEKIIRDYAGDAGWLQVQPNIKQSVYLQYLADTEAQHAEVVRGLAWTDFRRMPAPDARRALVDCLRRWMVAYRAYPGPGGQDLLDRCLREITGEGLLVWLHHDPDAPLVTHAESRALGYDAQEALREILPLSSRFGEDDARRALAESLFQKRILPTYSAIKAGDEKQRGACARLLREALAGYQLSPELRYLDFVFEELTTEIKFAWVDVDARGAAFARAENSGIDALAVLRELCDTHPERYQMLEVRARIADRRHADQLERYFLEISEFRHENRQPERAVAISVIQKMKGIYLFYPQVKYLELSWDELNIRSTKGRIRWNAYLFGVFPLNANHYENQYLNFDYKFERFELKRLLDNQFAEMQRVMREVGAL
jgi:hypothetical protein